ncbi:hypothetical protein [Geitlerinema sp. PCC 7407]|uniref:hypothetical protein n=1 Tax=Geitlerinema sp. PCC 7407 TaxID=1173025 RepID=UPI00029F85B8|nr:hypothetical protein [Geitlerinema sp. PCC 7407]AFY64918.1 hypothetical protein GEI7407_0417 [Geitlerinema sp. PCC 7407]
MAHQSSAVIADAAVSQITHRILASGKITRADQKSLQKITLMNTALSNESEQRIQTLFDRLQMGLIKVVE